MGLILLGLLLFYIFYKAVEMDDDDLMDDFIMPRDAMSIARGENPLDPKAQWKSTVDPLDLFGGKR